MTETLLHPEALNTADPLYLFQVKSRTFSPTPSFVALAHDAAHAVSLVVNAYPWTYDERTIGGKWTYADSLVAEKLIDDPIVGPCAAWLGDQE